MLHLEGLRNIKNKRVNRKKWSFEVISVSYLGSLSRSRTKRDMG